VTEPAADATTRQELPVNNPRPEADRLAIDRAA
jgi:hypothetical protein